MGELRGRPPKCLGFSISFIHPRLASHRPHFLPLYCHSLQPPCGASLLRGTAAQARLWQAHPHTGSQRSTYNPFLLARRARLQCSFDLLFHLREQTKKSLAGQGWGTQH